MRDSVLAAMQYGLKKQKMLEKSKGQFFLYAFLGGMFVAFGVLLYLSIGAPFVAAGSPGAKLAMGAAFPLAICLIIFAGGDLFTGNTMAFTIALLEKETTFKDTLKVWLFSYFGNITGCIVTVFIYVKSKIPSDQLIQYINDTAAHKIHVDFFPLFLRALLCNTLICLLIWAAVRMQTEIGKIAVFFFCILGMIGIGLEHSIANSATLSLSYFLDGGNSLGSILYSMATVTLGNIIGGCFCVGLPYWFLGKKDKVK